MTRCLIVLSFVLALFTAGCLPMYEPYAMTPAQAQEHEEYVRRNTPPVLVVDESLAFYSDTQVEISVSAVPGIDGLWRVICLAIANKAQSEMKIIWDETYFIENGTQNGRFMSRDLPYERREESRVPDVILPGKVFGALLWPNAYVDFDISYDRGRRTKIWKNNDFGVGEYGVSIVVQTARVKKRILLFVTLQEQNM